MVGDDRPAGYRALLCRATVRKLHRLGCARGVRVRTDEERGKGSHVTVYVGERFTVIKDRRNEIGRDLPRAILRQLGLTERDLG
jgi:mRNA interferase HicA